MVGGLYGEQEEHLLAFAYFCQSLQLFPTEQAQMNFDEMITRIEGEYIENRILYKQVAGAFEQAGEQRIVYLDKRCQDEVCQFAFTYQTDTPEVLPPFLIAAADERSREVVITNKFFDPNQGIIILETDAQYEDAELSFLFPTCGREYYRASTE